MRTFLVTGGAGFIGSHIATALVDRGDEVRILDNFCTGFQCNIAHLAGRADIIRGDITDVDAVSMAMQGVDCVFHQAALASVPLSVSKPLDVHHAGATGTLMVLDQARRANVRRVVYAASSAAYGDEPFTAKRENDLPAPLSPYAVAKLTGEYYCQAFTRTYGLETVGLRYFNVFGPRQDPDSPYSAVIPIFITKLLAGVSPTVFGDGEQTRDFTFVGNVVHGNLLAADAERVAGKVINLADGRATSLRQLIQILNALLGTDVQATCEPPRLGDIKHSLADISQARSLLQYEPQFDLESGLRQSIDYYRSLVGVA